MIGQKLINILQSLDPEEFRKLKRAVSSPYFATNQRLQVLYDHLKKHYPEFDEAKFQKEKLYKKLYPKKPFNEGVLRVLIREFSTIVEDFMILERYRNDKYERKKLLVNEFGKRNLYDYFKKGTEELLSSNEENQIQDLEHFWEAIALYENLYNHPSTDKYNVNDKTLEQLMDCIDSYFVLAKYRYTQVLQNRNTIFKRKAEYRFFDFVRKHKDELFEKNKLITIYELLNRIHDSQSEEDFFKLKELFFPAIPNINTFDGRVIFFLGLNYCSRKITAGEMQFGKESLEWYKIGLENKLLFDNNKISDVSFTNIVTGSGREKEFAWAEEFIEKYSDHLEDSAKIETTAFCKAYLSYHQNKYEDALEIINTTTFSAKHQMNTRTLAIFSTFVLSLSDPAYMMMLQPQIESFKKYITRNKLFDEKKFTPHSNLLKILSRASKKLWANEDKKKVKTWMLSQIDKTHLLPSREMFKKVASHL